MRLQITDMTVIKWWVDASFAVHPNMRGHTGGVMMMGKGAIIATSTKQKLNTRSSTESELVGAHDVMPISTWTKYFIEAQGYQVKQSIMYQDNKSCILMENNGRASSSKRTKHINVRYFFITDRIAKGDIEIVYCPTNDMVADFFTKPLQGKLFKKFICQIMNIELDDPILRPAQDHRSVLEKETKPSLNKKEIGQTVGRDKTEIGQTAEINKLNISRTVPRQAFSIQNNKTNDKTNKNNVCTYADVLRTGRKV